MLSYWQLDRVTRVLNNGGVIAYPTESVYGLGCNPENLTALQKILTIKRRPAHKGLIILVSQLQQALPFVQQPSKALMVKLQTPQSRAITWLIPRKPSVSSLLCGNFETLAVRMTQHPVAKAICEFTGKALVSTSCNIAGKPAMKNTLTVRNHMQTKVDLVIGGQCGNQSPSQIIDLSNDRILRN